MPTINIYVNDEDYEQLRQAAIGLDRQVEELAECGLAEYMLSVRKLAQERLNLFKRNPIHD